jgi:hypothetical protein
MGVPTDHAVFLQRKGYVPPWPGAFTGEEAAILARFGHWMEALATGAIAPVTPEQQHFLQAARGEVTPETPFERVWAKLRQQPPPAAPPPEAPEEAPPPESEDARGKFEELQEARLYHEQLKQQVEAEREAVLSAVRAQLDALEAKYKEELEDAARAVEELEAEVKTEVLQCGQSARLGGVQAIYYRGAVTWDGKGLQQYVQNHPELERFRKVGQPRVVIKYK